MRLNNIGLVTLLLLGACRTAYKSLQPATGDAACIQQFAPHFTNNLYSTQVNVLSHHLSGLLFCKQMPDSSVRMVFANEMGFKFFDFEYTAQGTFIKHYLFHKMDKPAVVKTLQQDFELVLLRPDLRQAQVLTDGKYQYVAIPSEKGRRYFITDKDCRQLVRIEKSSARKAVVIVKMWHYQNGTPDSISIHHTQFKFNIALQKTQQATD
ncbi:hypothetical protein [Chitinophaga costaii]|uniref:hypothetical protein n=1 Tax=Chitinophaga costaii TaxID=1335309 RepID=UPI000F50CAFB|nr:hypothetical protein [Chitinophaga costaii]